MQSMRDAKKGLTGEGIGVVRICGDAVGCPRPGGKVAPLVRTGADPVKVNGQDNGGRSGIKTGVARAETRPASVASRLCRCLNSMSP